MYTFVNHVSQSTSVNLILIICILENSSFSWYESSIHISHILPDRHVFLGFCQENHFEFSEVSDICWIWISYDELCILVIRFFKAVFMIKFNSNRGGVQWFRYLWLFINSVKMIFSLGIAGYVSNVHSIISVIRVSFYRFIPIPSSRLMLLRVIPKILWTICYFFRWWHQGCRQWSERRKRKIEIF